MIDVGGGDSRLVDRLIDRGVECVTVVDISGAALRRAQRRLPNSNITWIEADVTGDWGAAPVDFWHDRAVFHFLTEAADRARYIEHLKSTLRAGGQAVIATFGPGGPPKCSGLAVLRYSPEALATELGPAFRLEERVCEMHLTPFGTTQEFWYSRLAMSPPYRVTGEVSRALLEMNQNGTPS